MFLFIEKLSSWCEACHLCQFHILPKWWGIWNRNDENAKAIQEHQVCAVFLRSWKQFTWKCCFSFKLEFSEHKQYGGQYENGTFYGTVGTLAERQADLSINAFTNLYSRSKVFVFHIQVIYCELLEMIICDYNSGCWFFANLSDFQHPFTQSQTWAKTSVPELICQYIFLHHLECHFSSQHCVNCDTCFCI